MKTSSDRGDPATSNPDLGPEQLRDGIAMALGGVRFDTEAVRQFWDAVLRQIKAYAEAAEPHAELTGSATRDSPSLIDESVGGDWTAFFYDLPQYRALWATVEQLDVPFYFIPAGP